MTNPVAILGTTSSHGGSMISASGSKLQTNLGPACLVGDQHSCPLPGHGITPIVSNGSTRLTVQGTPVALEGSVAGCGAVLTGNFAANIGVV